MAFAKLNDINLYYELEGEGEPIMFFSGFSTHRESWRYFANQLSENYQTVIFDHRGAGQTDAPAPPYTIEIMAQDAVNLLDHLEIPQAHMVGGSMGAAIIQTIALRHPQRIKKGVLLSPFAKLPGPSIMTSETVAKLLTAGISFDLILEGVLPWLYSNAFLSDAKLLEDKKKEMLSNPFPQKPEGYLGQLTALQNYDITDEVEKIEADLFLIAGSEDLSTPLYCAAYLYKHLPSCSWKVFEKVGHMAHVERREDVLKLIQDFLQETL
jgi:3-oxoadipate enol-lactonase